MFSFSIYTCCRNDQRAQRLKSSEPERSEWRYDRINVPLPVEREASHARVQEQVSSARALPHAVVNPHARCPHPCHRRPQNQFRRAVGVRVRRSPPGAKYPRSFGHRIARTTCWYSSCISIPERKNGMIKRWRAPGGKGEGGQQGRLGNFSWVWMRGGDERTTMWVSMKLETVLKIPSAPLGCSSHQRGKHSEKSLKLDYQMNIERVKDGAKTNVHLCAAR